MFCTTGKKILKNIEADIMAMILLLI